MNVLAIMIGGSIGAICRHGLFVVVQRLAGPVFPFGTLVVNLLGCFLIGLLWGLTERSHIGEEVRLFIFTGFLGSFTTFSTFSRESVQLLKVGEWKSAAAYLALSVVVGLVCTAAGFLLAKKFLAAFMTTR